MFKRSHPIPAFREIVFHLATSAGGVLTGQTFSTTDLQIRKPGESAYADADAGQQAAVVEIGGGDYVYTATEAEFDTVGKGFAFKVNKSGALLWTLTDEIVDAYFATAAAGTLVSNAFTSDRTEADNVWRNVLAHAISGTLAGQTQKIGSYANAGGLFTLAPGLAFSGAPSAGDVFELLVR